MPITHVNPEQLPRNPAFSQAVRVDPPATTVYVGGQNGIRPDGTILEGLGAQTAQAFENLRVVLDAAGASFEDVVKWTISVVDGEPLDAGFAAFQQAWGRRSDPPALSVAIVAGLANPRFLVEIDAVAVIP